MHKHLRVSVLLIILFIIAVGTWVTQLRVTDWSKTLRIAVYPINADNSEVVADYIDSLTVDDFEPINEFFKTEIIHYQYRNEEPIYIGLASEVNELPPPIPVERSLLNIIMWSLKLRYWAFTRDEYTGPKPHIQLFALYYNPATTHHVAHSTGLEKGHVAVINLYADKAHHETNLFVITHELLHTLGATDKYELATNQPIYPIGFAEPDLEPLYPQTLAEVMGGRIPLSPHNSKIPSSLDEVVIGPETALEIRLIDEL